MADKIRTHIALLLMLMLFSLNTEAQQSTISNNLLYDATLTPNLRLGISLSPHWSMGVTGGYRPWPTSEETSRKWKHLLVSPEVRYWTDSVFHRQFFGLNLIYSHYNVADVKFPFGLYPSVRDERRQGDLAALGLFYGYSFNLARNLRLEAIIGAALGYTWFDSYKCGHCGMKLGEDQKVFAMPQAAINVVYNIPKRSRRNEYGTPAEVHYLPITHTSDSAEFFQPELELQPSEPEPQQTLAETSHIDQLLSESPLLAKASDYQLVDLSKPTSTHEGAVFIYFPVSKYNIIPDFRDNASVLSQVVEVARKVKADSICSIDRILIVGYASVDGGLWGNERLASRRALALKAYIQEQTGLPDSLFDVQSAGESWADVREYLSDAGVQSAVDLIDHIKDPVLREQRLRNHNGGKTWSDVRRHFVNHRSAGLIRIYIK
ncbi:MAG: DUF3575 domain-containing protein [Prevotella sp.]|nr:DUF3575 domain-containing protein [Prevotella sp.]